MNALPTIRYMRRTYYVDPRLMELRDAETAQPIRFDDCPHVMLVRAIAALAAAGRLADLMA